MPSLLEDFLDYEQTQLYGQKQPLESDDHLYVSIDWVRLYVPSDSIKILSQIWAFFKVTSEEKFIKSKLPGTFFGEVFPEYWVSASSARVGLKGEAGNYLVYLDFPGETCQRLGFVNLLEFLRNLAKIYDLRRFTRLDIAVDDFQQAFSRNTTPIKLEELALSKNIKNIDSGKSFSEFKKDKTVHLGSRRGARMLRWYVKTVGDVSYDRYECEFKRHIPGQLLQAICSTPPISELSRILASQALFVKINQPWFYDLQRRIDYLEIRTPYPKITYSLQKIETFLERQVCPSLAVCQLAMGTAFEPYFRELLAKGRNRLNDYQKAVILENNPDWQQTLNNQQPSVS